MAPADDTELPGDPFWDVVQQRHPDVDIVILPPEPPAESTGEPVSLTAARRLAGEVDELFEQVWQMVLGTAPADSSPVRWEAGTSSGTGTPVRSGRVEDLDADRARELVTVADASLTARAWRVAPPTGAFHRVSATSEGTTVNVSAHATTCRVEVRGPDVVVGREALRELRREARP